MNVSHNTNKPHRKNVINLVKFSAVKLAPHDFPKSTFYFFIKFYKLQFLLTYLKI